MGSEISQISHQVEPVCPYFRGRESDLGKLDQLFEIRRRKGNKTPVVCVKGVPGVGKTELLKFYCKVFLETKGGHCLWYDKGSYRSMLHSVRRLGDHPSLQVPIAGMLDTSGMTSLFGKLTSSKECLIVFDNINWDEELSGILAIILRVLVERPDPKKFVSVLMCGSCSLKDITDDISNDMILLPLTDIDSVNFLRNSLKISRNEETDILIRHVCNKVIHFPWALSQIAAFVNKSPSVDKFQVLKTYFEALDVKTSDKHMETPYDEIAYLLWKSFQTEVLEKEGQIGEIAGQLLRIMAYLSPYDINVHDWTLMHSYIYKLDYDNSLSKRAIGLLSNYSLVEVNGQWRNSEVDFAPIAIDDYLTSDVGKVKIQNLFAHVLRVDAEIDGNTEWIVDIIEQYNTEDIFRDNSGNRVVSLYWMEHTGYLYDYLQKRPQMFPEYRESDFGQTVENNRMMMKICSLGIGR